MLSWCRHFRSADDKLTPADFTALYGPILDYDASAMERRATKVREGSDNHRLAAGRACEADADQCLTVADELVANGNAEEAVAAYERALVAARDRVAVSNSLDWLVQHHFEHGRIERALEVAQQAAAVGSSWGLQTLGQLLERMGRYQEAEQTYKAVVERYPVEPEVLWGFYIRHEKRHGDGLFQRQARDALGRLFPGGMGKTSLTELGAPLGATLTGVPVENLVEDLKPAGARFGDIIVAVDGYRVITSGQYLCVMRLTDEPDVTLIVARERKYLELKGKIQRRLYGPRSSAVTVVGR